MAAESALETIERGFRILEQFPFACRKAAHTDPRFRELLMSFGRSDEARAVRERSRRAWVLSLPFPLRFLLATHPALIGRVLGIIIASIEDPPVIERILSHLASKDLPGLWAESRAPPVS